jgi:hypothetical protein
MKYLLLVVTLLTPLVVLGQHNHPGKEMRPPSLVSGLGDVNHPVSTTNAEAQKFFNQGLAYIYAFNHEGAARSFRRAAELVPQTRPWHSNV